MIGVLCIKAENSDALEESKQVMKNIVQELSKLNEILFEEEILKFRAIVKVNNNRSDYLQDTMVDEMPGWIISKCKKELHNPVFLSEAILRNDCGLFYGITRCFYGTVGSGHKLNIVEPY